MRREDDQALWDVLGKAAQPELSPFFARNVLREIRNERGWRERAKAWFSLKKLVPATGVAVVILALALFSRTPPAVPEDAPPDTIAQVEAQDYEVIVDLDDLIAWEEDSLWTESSSL